MAAPTKTEDFKPNHVIHIEGTDVDVTDHDYELSYNGGDLEKGFSIAIPALTNATVTLHGANKDEDPIDVTADLWPGATPLVAGQLYVCDINLPVKKLVVRVTPTNATNSVDLTIFSARI